MVEEKKEEKDLLLSHEYDGIKELDNDLPPWWINLFYVTIVFAIIYLLGYQVYGWFDNQEMEYKKEVLAFESNLEKIENTIAKPVGVDEIKLEIAAGETIYKTNCVACHGPTGGGGALGPNLTDKYWLHGGGNYENLIKVISEGVPAKGMLAWKPILGEKSVRQAARYVESIQGSNPADAKSPQGILYDPIDMSKPLTVLKDKESLERGALLYKQYCGYCHGEDKKGGFASNLSDKVWSSGKGTVEDVMKAILEGNIPLNMPAWKEVITEKDAHAISSFILNESSEK